MSMCVWHSIIGKSGKIGTIHKIGTIVKKTLLKLMYFFFQIDYNLWTIYRLFKLFITDVSLRLLLYLIISEYYCSTDTECEYFFRLHEFDEQVQSVREGMARVVPVPLLSLFTGYELETMVCVSQKMLRVMSIKQTLQKTNVIFPE